MLNISKIKSPNWSPPLTVSSFFSVATLYLLFNWLGTPLAGQWIEAQAELACDPPLAVTIDGISEACRNDSVTLTAVVSGGETPFVYNWSIVGEKNIIGQDESIRVAADQDAIYQVMVSATCENETDTVTASHLITTKDTPLLKLVRLECDFEDPDSSYFIIFRAVADTIIATANNKTFDVEKIEVIDGPDTTAFDYQVRNVPSGEILRLEARFNDSDCVVVQEFEQTCARNCPDSIPQLDLSLSVEPVCVGDPSVVTATFTGGIPIYLVKWSKEPTFEDYFAENKINSSEPGAITTLNQQVLGNPGDRVYVKVSSPCGVVLDTITLEYEADPFPERVSYACDVSDSTYCVSFDLANNVVFGVTPNSFPLEDQGNQSFEICKIPYDESIELALLDTVTGCDTTFTLAYQRLNVEVFVGNGEICAGSPDTLIANATGSIPPYEYAWYTDPTFSGTPIGEDRTLIVTPEVTTDYYLLVKTECEQATDAGTILVNPIPEQSLDSSYCDDVGAFFTVIFESNADEINPSAGVLSDLGNGTYQVENIPTTGSIEIIGTFSDSNCSDTLVVMVPMPCGCTLEVMAKDTVVCEALPFDLVVEATTSGGTGTVLVDWYEGLDTTGIPVLLGSPVQISVTASVTTYVVVARDEEGCIATDTLVVTVDSPPVITINPTCSEDNSSYSVTGNTTGDLLTVNDIPLPLDPNGDFSIINNPSDVDLVLVATDTITGCITRDTISGKDFCCIFTDCPPEILANRLCIIRGDSTLLDYTVPDCPECIYEWSPTNTIIAQDGGVVVVQPSSTTKYIVTVTDPNACDRCSAEIDIIVTDCGPENIFIPTAFTPNNDGLNDDLVMRVFNVTYVKLIVFNRFGQNLVDYEWENPDNQIIKEDNGGIPLSIWDGTYEGDQLPPDVYGYYLEAKCAFDGEDLTYTSQGNITLLR